MSALSVSGGAPLPGGRNPGLACQLAEVSRSERGPRGHIGRPLAGLECGNDSGEVLGAFPFVGGDLPAGSPDGGLVLIHSLILAQRCCASPARPVAFRVSAIAMRNMEGLAGTPVPEGEQ